MSADPCTEMASTGKEAGLEEEVSSFDHIKLTMPISYLDGAVG